MAKSKKKWGFLARTREVAERMEKKYGVHFTPLIDYMKVIFPEIDDWEENRFAELDITDEGKPEYIKLDLCSKTGRKIVLFWGYIEIYDENYVSTGSGLAGDGGLSWQNEDVYFVYHDVQLTNATVKQIFGVDVKEPLFDENTPTIIQPWECPHQEGSAESVLQGKYVGDEKQYQVNLEAYRALYDNIGLSKIIVKKLFDLYDYEIDLNNKRKISILIGPNGCGKTTILKIVRFMLSGEGNIHDIFKIPFESVTCVLANGKKLKFKFSNNKISVYINSQKVTSFANDKMESKNYREIYRQSLKEYNCRFNTEFISAQRLLGEIDVEQIEEENVHQYLDNISKIKGDFKNFCKETESRYYRQKSYTEHRVFDKYIGLKTEILEASVFEEMWKEFIKKKCEYEFNKAFYSSSIPESELLEVKRDKMLVEKYKDYSEDKKEFFCLYLKMFYGKLFWLEFEKAHKKTMLFQRIINDRFKITKKQLQYRFGEMYLTIGEGKDEKEIPLDVLSSGEKNDFILFYNLIFNCKESKVLIDEPEISQHIEWQERFIDDLLEICEMNNIQALVATHSPCIINDHTDLIAKWEIKNGMV